MAIAVAHRYARALADVIGRAGDYRAVLGDLQDFAATYRGSAELRSILETPGVPFSDKARVLEAVLVRQGASDVTRRFLRVLLANYRMRLLEQIVQAFRKVAYSRLGIVEVKVATATALPEPEREAMRTRFGTLTSKQVELEYHLNADLLGGILAQIGSTVYDGTVRGHLERIRQQLTGS